MKQMLALLTFLAVFSQIIFAAIWEIKPLVPTANITEFNIDSFNSSIWNVTMLSNHTEPGGEPLAGSSSDDGPKCEDDANRPGFCKLEEDETKCNLAIRVPGLPRPHWQEHRVDAWVYNNKCSVVRGCKLLQNRDDWFSTFSDLKYTVEVWAGYSQYPWFAYADYKCNGFWSFGWSYIMDDVDHNGPSIYVYRHSFPCSQP